MTGPAARSGEAPLDPPNAAGAVVMAVGIFCAASLPRLPVGLSLTVPAAVVVSLIWLATAGALAASIWRRGALARRTAPPVDSFGIGTWVAGTAVLARVLMLALPHDPWPARAAFAVAAGLWLWFIPRALRNLLRLLRSRARPGGIVLLSTVATQAVALIALRLFPDFAEVRQGAAALMGLGAVCYVMATFAVVRGHAGGNWQLAADWSNGNCILHGALSITGLTAVVSGHFAGPALLAYWVLVLAVFAAVEAIELVRLAVRVRGVGWRAAVLVYDVSQWARNFTFGMLYAFTFAFAQAHPIPEHPALSALREGIVGCGAYAVLVLLAVETALMLATPRARV